MKKCDLVIEVGFSDKVLRIFPEEGESDVDYRGKQKQKELRLFRQDFLIQVRKDTIKMMKDFFNNGDFDKYFFDQCDELGIEGFESVKDYGISIKVTEVRK